MANKAQNKKLYQEIAGLVVVAILAGGYFAYNSIHNAKNAVPVTKQASPLQTTFDTNAIDHFNTTSTYPDVSPNSSELGKTDPFAQ